jgi:hypothetical protein
MVVYPQYNYFGVILCYQRLTTSIVDLTNKYCNCITTCGTALIRAYRMQINSILFLKLIFSQAVFLNRRCVTPLGIITNHLARKEKQLMVQLHHNRCSPQVLSKHFNHLHTTQDSTPTTAVETWNTNWIKPRSCKGSHSNFYLQRPKFGTNFSTCLNLLHFSELKSGELVLWLTFMALVRSPANLMWVAIWGLGSATSLQYSVI